MRIANFTDTYIPHNNGIATILYGLHHTKKGWDDQIFGPIKHPDVTGVSGIPFPLFPEYKIALNTGWLEKEARDFDLIHNHTPYGMFYYGIKISKRLGKPLVGSFHTDPAAIFGALVPLDSAGGRLLTWPTWQYLIYLYRKCDVVIATSEWVKTQLEARKLGRHIEIIPNGVNIKKFSPDIDSQQFRDRYGIPDRPMVFFAGRLEHKKDPQTFLRAAIESKSDAVFVVSGRGELEEKLRKMCRDMPNIIFTGYLPDELIPQAFAAADLFVMPSEMETQGIVLLEALASGTPCIATNTGIAKDVIDPEFLIEPRDANGLAEKVDALIEDKKRRKKLARHGRKLVEKEYSLDVMVKRLGQLYDIVCEPRLG